MKTITKGKKLNSITFFDVFNVIFLGVLAIVTVYPFWHQMMISVSSTEDIYNTSLMLIPKEFNWSSYKVIFGFKLLWRGYLNTIIRTIAGTALSLTLTVLTAYPLIHDDVPFKKFFTGMMLVTMFFNGGLVPNYILIRNLGLINTLGALIIPGAISAFNVLIIRNYLNTLPRAVEEAALIDGASNLCILFNIMLPLMVPVIATVGLWIGVGHWQSWYDNLLYITSPDHWGFMMLTRKLVVENVSVGSIENVVKSQAEYVDQRQLRAAVIMMAVVPMILVYPWIQKYFSKGIVLGAVK